MNLNRLPGMPDGRMKMEDNISKTADFAGSTYDMREGFNPGGHGQAMSVLVQASATDRADADETYTFTVQDSDDGQSWRNISVGCELTDVGWIAIPVFLSKRYVRVSLTVGGTTPAITYTANLVAMH